MLCQLYLNIYKNELSMSLPKHCNLFLLSYSFKISKFLTFIHHILLVAMGFLYYSTLRVWYFASLPSEHITLYCLGHLILSQQPQCTYVSSNGYRLFLEENKLAGNGPLKINLFPGLQFPFSLFPKADLSVVKASCCVSFSHLPLTFVEHLQVRKGLEWSCLFQSNIPMPASLTIHFIKDFIYNNFTFMLDNISNDLVIQYSVFLKKYLEACGHNNVLIYTHFDRVKDSRAIKRIC